MTIPKPIAAGQDLVDVSYTHLFRVVAEDCALRVLVPPAVAAREVDSRQEVLNAIARDGRDPVTGQFA